MPPGYVKTIREEILYEYAKLISRSAYGTLQRGFITEGFKKLRDGAQKLLFLGQYGSGKENKNLQSNVSIAAQSQI